MRAHLFIFLALLLPINTAWSDSSEKVGNDLYSAGEIINIEGSSIDNVFAVARVVNLADSIKGSAHVLAQNITIRDRIGGNLYAAGETIHLFSPLLGDANLAAESLIIISGIANDLRAAGDYVEINSNIGGDLLAVAKTLVIQGVVSGSAALAVAELTFSPDARIDGQLILYTDDAQNFTIPNHVIPAGRVIYKSFADIDDEFYTAAEDSVHQLKAAVKLFIITTIIFAIVTLARQKSNNAYRRAFKSIWASFFHGLVALSVLIGGVISLSLTVIGIPISILVLFATVIICVLAYLLGNYFIVSRIWEKLRDTPPYSTLGFFIAALLSAICAATIVTVPWLGWFMMLAVTLFGLGGMSPWRLQEHFRSSRQKKVSLRHTD